MSATVVTGRVADAFLGPDLGPETLYHGHSFGGNALAAAVARRHLELLDERDVLSRVHAREAELRSAPRRPHRPAGGSPRDPPLRPPRRRGAGHDRGPLLARRVAAATVERGVLVRSLGASIPLVPPLTVEPAELERIVEALRTAILETVPVTA